ncbi:MAG: hypothetical protein IIZ59_01020 [Clostridia bacterium]|nr:hypothetical protein [Clostridia bacterium]
MNINIRKIISLAASAALLTSAIAFPVSAQNSLMGDVNGSGVVESNDALMILRHSVNLTEFDEEQKKLADVNYDDGNIDSADALDVLLISVELLDVNDRNNNDKKDTSDDVSTDKEVNTDMIEEKVHVLSFPYGSTGERKVRVYVPEHKEGETFPVIYMTDGQNLFEDDTVAFGCWYTREAVRAEREVSGKAAIIVGIHNDAGDMQRSLELTPAEPGALDFPAEMSQEQRDAYIPQGGEFADFVINSVMPEIEKNFPVKTGRENTAFCGSSMGGIESFYIGLAYPDKFSAVGAFSPVFMMYVKSDFESWIRTKAIQEELPFMYMYVGGADEMEKQLAVDFEWVGDIMEDCYPENQLKKLVVPENRHHESGWEPIFKDFLHIFLENAE